MLNAIILFNVERNKINQVAGALADIDGISEVYSVAGRYDLVAIIRVKDQDKLADLVTSGLINIEGIIKSETLTAFQVHSQHDLDRMFSL
ncbi:MAG: Lrp/AsnC family transcriptional regulator [Candidatus Margulisiibacteriota bacterium]|nr:MAG: AsnC family transcriptional regulator [Candidatus Margulisbacteria bacterium GWD2_39_127]OGI04026.1 MAG: AsnC family transcriptional regulator [Candidatus Margulisbacteria bacterium GWF2_38_17]OGI11982.1 MAG: AsnC family transcriptional regulator [Candidatus Margulisbacteria bacterium GWE2_39_32]PZM80240.1 MAG: Lrp/AsnC family transcriptional regulator [Candidatus Margulisiibacteriota bacterium]HAR63767.1 AsnC family transcriptional regulator [Candidatus Margulisiibacteriota bacterium]